MTSSRHGAIVVSAIVAVCVLAACNGEPPPPRPPTAIESFTVTPNPVAPGGTITLTWRTANVGLYEGTPYCTLQRTVQSEPADDAQEVDCNDTITATAPSIATTMTYRLSALKRDGAAYVTRDITITVRPVTADAMVIEVNTDLIAGTTITLPLRGTVDVTVDWGDDHTSARTSSGDLQHTYASNGRYTVRISGNLSHFGNGWDEYPHADAITAVSAWGELGLTSLWGAFNSASNLTSVPATLPTNVTDTRAMFWGASSFNHPIGAWDTSNVTTMSNMFDGASAFNQAIGAWNTSNVTNMTAVFRGASAFNQPISTWNTSNVTNMTALFDGASAFNQPIGNWDTSNVTGMNAVFNDASAFDQPIGNWNTSSAQDMGFMFGDASAFNQPLNDWNTSAVTNMDAMFLGAGAFNQPLDTWDTSNVTNMTLMFANASAFNRDLSGWCVALIPSRPDGFDDGATSWTLPRPAWGTCPTPGESQWTRQFGTGSSDYGWGVAVDASGNVFVAGQTGGSLVGTNAGGQDAFLRKYDTNGTVLWTRQFGTSSDDYGRSVAVDVAGNAVVVGNTSGSLVGGNAGGMDAFVRKFDPNGTVLWTRQFGTTEDDFGRAVAVDGSGNVIVVGYTAGAVAGSNAGLYDVFVRKYDANGNVLWTRQFGSSSNDLARGAAADTSGNVFVAGHTRGSLAGSNTGGADAFVRKYDADGNVSWTHQFGTVGDDISRGVAVGSDGIVVLVGYTDGAVTGSNAGLNDAFVRKLDASGNVAWTRQFGTSANDAAWGVAVDASGRVIVVGDTYGDLQGGGNGGGDAFIRTYSQAGNLLATSQFGTTDLDYAWDAAVDAAGTAYAVGSTLGSLAATNAGNYDVFVQKLTP